MADPDAVRDAARRLVDMIGDVDDHTRGRIPDCTISVLARDLDLAFLATLVNGCVQDLREVDPGTVGSATLRISGDSDALLDVVDGRVHFAQAWAGGRIRVDAKFRDLLKLRSFL